MPTWYVDPGLATLIRQWKALNPGATVYTIGDPDHQGSDSDHNPEADGSVDAGDFMPGNGVTFADLQTFVNILVHNKDKRIAYIIIGQRIISSTVQPWVWRTYNGNYHGHAHVSVNDKYESDSSDWKLTIMTTPSHAQMVSAATTGTLGYSGGGLPGDIAGGNFLNYFTKLYRDIADQNDEVDTTLDAIGAALINTQSMLTTILQDPAAMSNPETHPVVRAVRWTLANPTN